MSALHIPEIPEDADAIKAALAYAGAGFYVLPVNPTVGDGKHPGSVVGDGWPAQSSRDPDRIVAWFAAKDYGIALHCGRSGAVILDVDHPENVPDEVAVVMETAGCPYQSTRPDQPGRGHYLLANDTGRTIGNGLGKLATEKKWGEVRGANGVIIVAPSVHPAGGHYRWERTGLLPGIPDYVAEALPDSTAPEDTATDAQVKEFLGRHTRSDRPEALAGLANALRSKLTRGASCHMSTLGVVTDAMAEAAAGQYPAQEAANVLWPLYLATVTTGTSTGRILTDREAKHQFAGILAWAVGQAPAGAARAAERVRERLPQPVTDVDAAEFGGWELADDEHQGDEPAAPKLAALCLTRDQLASLPDPEPLIDNVLDRGTVALLYGRWGTGKSFVALDWGGCVAAGKGWQGRAVEQQRVLYLAAEGAHGLKIRTDSWEAGWQRKIPDEQFTVLRRAINLTNYAEVRELAALIDWGGYGFVIIDTIARCMVGADENSAKDCGQVVDALGRLLDKTPGGRGVVTGVHHTGKDGKTFRGSSVFEAGADTVYALQAEGRAINLNREKRKDGPITDMHGLTIEAVEGTKSCIISLHRGVEKPERAQRLLSTFLHHFSTTGATKTELRVVSDLTEGTFYRALSDLLQSGDLVNEGTEKRPFYKGVVR